MPKSNGGCPSCRKEYKPEDIIGTVPKNGQYVHLVECKHCGRVFEIKPINDEWRK